MHKIKTNKISVGDKISKNVHYKKPTAVRALNFKKTTKA